jgi:hypothetical protein
MGVAVHVPHIRIRRYRFDMAFVLKLTDDETDLLRAQAEREHRSMHEVARLAVLERIAGAEQDEQRGAFIRDELPNWAPVMQRLAES